MILIDNLINDYCNLFIYFLKLIVKFIRVGKHNLV